MTEAATLDTIAATLAGDDATSTDASTVDANLEELISEDPALLNTDDDDLDDDLEEDDEDDVEDDEGDDEDDADISDSEPDGPVIDVQDEDLIEVVIDGEIEYRTVAEAKQALSGEGAYDKRVKEATEMRKSAAAEQAHFAQARSRQIGAFQDVIGAVGQLLLQPRIKAPDESVKNSNPAQYVKHKDVYENEVRRVQQAKDQIASLYTQMEQEHENMFFQKRQVEGQRLMEALPALSDPEQGPQRERMILESADFYGFTPDEIGMANDHRLFLMAHDAALYRASQGKGAKETLQKAKKRNKPPKTLRGGTTKRRTRTTANAKRRKALHDNAAVTGRVDDIAALIRNG